MKNKYLFQLAEITNKATFKPNIANFDKKSIIIRNEIFEYRISTQFIKNMANQFLPYHLLTIQHSKVWPQDSFLLLFCIIHQVRVQML
jgi:hypothetical protein